MKKLSLFLAFIVLAGASMAQRSRSNSKNQSELKAKISEVSKEKGMFGGSRNGLIGVDEEYGETYTLSSTGKIVFLIPMNVKLRINKYDSRFRKIGSNKIKIKGLPIKTRLLGSELFGDNIALITSRKGKKRSQNMYITKVSKDNLEKTGEVKVLSTSKGKGDRNASFNYIVSENREYMCAYTMTSNRRRPETKMSISMINKDCKVEWKKNKVLKHNLKGFTVLNTFLTNEGKLILYGFESESKNKFFSIKTVVGEPVFMIIDEDNIERVEVDWEGGTYITDMEMAQTAEGVISLAGLYGKKDDRVRGVYGAFWADFNIEEGGFDNVQYEEFEKDFIQQTWSERAKKKAAKKAKRKKKRKSAPALYNYLVRDLIPTSDGGDLMCAEQYYMYVTTSTDSKGNVTYTYHYVYQDIIVIKRNKDHEVEWKSVINKYQHTINDNGSRSSYSVIENKDKNTMHFVFNDNIGNYDDVKKKKTTRTTAVPMSLNKKRYCVSEYEIDLSDGSGKRNLLLTPEKLDKRMIVKPRDAYLIEEKTKLVMKAASKKKNQTITLSVD